MHDGPEVDFGSVLALAFIDHGLHMHEPCKVWDNYEFIMR